MSRGHGQKLAEAMEETKVVQQLMRYATRARPAVVVLESVSDLLGPVRMRGCGEEIERILRANLHEPAGLRVERSQVG